MVDSNSMPPEPSIPPVAPPVPPETTAVLADTAPAGRLALGGGTLTTPVPLPRRRPLTIGTREDCGLRVHDATVSAVHAAIEWREGHYRICDLGSTNGTYVDGVRVRQARLCPGARLRLGRSSFELRMPVKATPSPPLPPHPILGSSRALREALGRLQRLAPLRLPVLLRGETGTGKELFAQTLHAWSPRADASFVALNCAAIPDRLAESELFGHARGAFTGAERAHAGAFVEAHEGTLFLDEIGELDPSQQAKLLRVLEHGRVRPVGGDTERRVDVRIVAATHRDLDAMVRAGAFREDLFHRLGVLPLRLPPLRERREDIPALMEHFAAQIGEELGRRIHFTAEAIERARAAQWPGNVRALRNAVLRAAVLDEPPLGADALCPKAPGPTSDASKIEIPRGSYARMKRALVERVVAEEGSIRRAAKVLEIPRSTLGAWLKGR